MARIVFALGVLAMTAWFVAPANAAQQKIPCVLVLGPGPNDPPTQVCEKVGNNPPPPAPTDLERVPVTGLRLSTDYSWWDFYRQTLRQSLYLNQTGPVEHVSGVEGATLNSGNPALNAGCEGNPVIYATGNKVEPELDFTTTGEVPLYLQRVYNHFWNRKGLFGRFWVSNFDFKIEKSADGLTIKAYRNDGSRVDFVHGTTPSVAWWEDRLQPTARIVSDGAGGYVYYAPDNSV